MAMDEGSAWEGLAGGMLLFSFMVLLGLHIINKRLERIGA